MASAVDPTREFINELAFTPEEMKELERARTMPITFDTVNCTSVYKEKRRCICHLGRPKPFIEKCDHLLRAPQD